jgi:hypothetical protein
LPAGEAGWMSERTAQSSFVIVARPNFSGVTRQLALRQRAMRNPNGGRMAVV